jgi:hypothetical protein
MQSSSLDLKKISIVSGILIILLFVVLLLMAGTPKEIIIQSTLRSGLIITIVGAFWVFFNRVGWRLKIFRVGGWLSDKPILAGRWEGVVCRNGEDEHPFILEITQTYSSIQFKTFSKNSRGESLTATIHTNDLNASWCVYCIWRTRAARRDGGGDEIFLGASTWHISINRHDQVKIIEDNYFTDRNPSTHGIMRVEWKSNHLLHRFK